MVSQLFFKAFIGIQNLRLVIREGRNDVISVTFIEGILAISGRIDRNAFCSNVLGY